jgi:hypothetical protein
MTRQALVALTVALAAGLGMSSVFSQTPPNTTQLQPAPDIPGVIKGGTMPEVVIQGLTSSDDSFWLPNVGIIFSEPRANRIVRLDEHDQPVTFVGNLHGPLGMAFDAKNGRLVSLQTEPGFTGPRVVWPAGKEAILANNYQGKPFGRPNDIVADRNGGLYSRIFRPTEPLFRLPCTTCRLGGIRFAWPKGSRRPTDCSSVTMRRRSM